MSRDLQVLGRAPLVVSGNVFHRCHHISVHVLHSRVDIVPIRTKGERARIDGEVALVHEGVIAKAHVQILHRSGRRHIAEFRKAHAIAFESQCRTVQSKSQIAHKIERKVTRKGDIDIRSRVIEQIGGIKVGELEDVVLTSNGFECR